MSATKAKLVRYAGGQDVWGGHGVKFFNYTGPSSYANPGGDEVDSIGTANGNQTGLRNIDAIFGAVTVSGTYRVQGGPNAKGPTGTWLLYWFVNSTGLPVANGVDLSGETTIIGIVGG